MGGLAGRLARIRGRVGFRLRMPRRIGGRGNKCEKEGDGLEVGLNEWPAGGQEMLDLADDVHLLKVEHGVWKWNEDVL